MLDYRNMRARLGETVDPGSICRAFERERGSLSWRDLELLASIEDLYREAGDFAQPGDVPETD